MALHIVPAPAADATGHELNAPVDESGNAYAFHVTFPDGVRRGFTNHRADLLIPVCGEEYPQLTDEEQAFARYKAATQVAVQLQSDFVSDRLDDYSALTYEQKQAVMAAKHEPAPLPVLGDPDDVEGSIGYWEPSFPLVLLDAVYAPYTDTTPPLGNPQGDNLLWLSPMGEWEFITSLCRLRVIAVGLIGA